MKKILILLVLSSNIFFPNYTWANNIDDNDWLKKCSLWEQKKYQFKPQELELLQQKQYKNIIYPENLESLNGLEISTAKIDRANGKKLASICANCHALPNNDYASGQSNMGPNLAYLNQIALQKETATLQKYIYEKIYNAKAFHLCSAMPRFGEKKVFKPQEIIDIMGYLFKNN